MRRGARRSARSLILDAVTAWTSISATGKVSQLTKKHEWLLKTATTSRSTDMGCQTEAVGPDINLEHDNAHSSVTHANMHGRERQERLVRQNEPVLGQESFEISSVGLGKFSIEVDLLLPFFFFFLSFRSFFISLFRLLY